MPGSKYTDEMREKALAMCASPNMNPTRVAKILNLPRATVYDWQRTAQERDPAFVAARRLKIKRMMDKVYRVVGRSVDGLDVQSRALTLEKSEIDRILLRILTSPQIDPDTAEAMVKIVKEYTGTSMTDMVKVMKECMDVHDKLDSQLHGGESNEIQLTFDDGSMEEMAE